MTEAIALDVEMERGAAVPAILRAFDEARRALSVGLTAYEGVGAGHPYLQLYPRVFELNDSSCVQVLAHIADAGPRHHRVEYAALVTNGDGSTELVAHAHGVTAHGTDRGPVPTQSVLHTGKKATLG